MNSNPARSTVSLVGTAGTVRHETKQYETRPNEMTWNMFHCVGLGISFGLAGRAGRAGG